MNKEPIQVAQRLLALENVHEAAITNELLGRNYTVMTEKLPRASEEPTFIHSYRNRLLSKAYDILTEENRSGILEVEVVLDSDDSWSTTDVAPTWNNDHDSPTESSESSSPSSSVDSSEQSSSSSSVDSSEQSFSSSSVGSLDAVDRSEFDKHNQLFDPM